MAANGTAIRRSTPAVPKPNVKEDTIPLDNFFAELENERSACADHVKEKLPRVKHAGSWSTEVNTGAGTKSKDPIARSTPSINKVPAVLAKAFPNGRPMGDKPHTLKCNHCKRPVAKHAMAKHVEACLNKKQEKQRRKKEAKDARDAAARKEKAGDSDEEDDDGSKKTASKTGGMTASKKRKATDEGDDGAPTKKKKKKDEPKAKAPRPKAPVDVEKQCGVELPQGGQCARSLTCKSHSMGAKRAVPGRSAPYDKLLVEYQRKNQAKMQKAAFDANAPNPDDHDLPSGPVDSEEEKDSVMASIARSFGGAPIYQPTYVPLRRKYEVNRIRGMMSSAFAAARSMTCGGSSSTGGGGGGGGGGGNFWGSGAIPGPTLDVDARRGSTLPAARSIMAAPASRKPSVASGA